MLNTVKLKDVCEFKRGLTYSKRDEVDYSSNIVVRATNIDLKNNKLNLAQLKYIKESIKINEDKILKKGDILICTASGSKSHLGKVALIYKDIKMAFGGFMGVLRTSEKCLPKFLYNILISQKFKKVLLSNTSGANINNLRFSQIENFEFILPSLQEQQDIVAKLDAAFAEIDNAIYVEEEKKKQIRPALKSIYKDILYNRQCSPDNKKSLLGDISRVVGGNGFPKSYQGHSNKEIPFIKVSDMNTQGNEKFIYKTAHTVDTNILKAIKAKAHEVGTLIFPKIGGAISTNKKRLLSKKSAYDNNIVGIKPSDKILPEYLHKIFKIIDIYELSNKATLPSINNPSIESIELFVPNLQEQSKIIKKLNLVDEHYTYLSDCVASKIHNFKLLKTAMIKQNLSREAV